MIQTLLMFLAPAQDPVTSGTERCPATSMATRKPITPSVQNGIDRKSLFSTWAAVLGNAAGFVLFLSSLWLVLRLAEILLS
jgi:hypothetical protein